MSRGGDLALAKHPLIKVDDLVRTIITKITKIASQI
jgi:hypothetical protein